jgi:hypothetical protein
MKSNNIKYSFLIILFLLSNNYIYSQQLRSEGKIKNNGRIIIKGNAVISQDSINGIIEFNKDDQSFNQYIPQIHYEKLILKGATPKLLPDSTRDIWISDEFISDNKSVIKYSPNTALYSRGKTVHDGAINPAFKYGTVYLDGNKLQVISGRGLFRDLELDNSSSCVVVDSGGFEISSNLILSNGLLFNTIENNFIMSDGSRIIRYDEGMLNEHPNSNVLYSVEYRGDEQILTGKEIPDDGKVMSLYVNNSSGIILRNNVEVQGTLSLAANIYTMKEDEKYLLSSFSSSSPIFLNDDAEIIGTFRRYFPDNDKMIFNNSFTSIEIEDDPSHLQFIEMTVLPETKPVHYNPNVVSRSIEIFAEDRQGNKIDTLPIYNLSVAWKHPNETCGLSFDDLILQRFDSHYWKNYDHSARELISSEWATVSANEINSSGHFAIGLPAPQNYSLIMKVLLEGAFMGEDMIVQKLPDLSEISSEHPFHYIEANSDISTGDNTDYLVVHLNSEEDDHDIYKLAILDKDGNVRNADGSYPLQLPIDELTSNNYQISILHHNHLDIITENEIEFKQFSESYLDFTQPHLILGRENSLKPVKVSGNNIIWAMIAGDIDDNNFIDEYDLGIIESGIGEISFLKNVNYLGFINTADFNYVWNNLGRVGAIVK